jgi:cytochrome c-type biogenesis protein
MPSVLSYGEAHLAQERKRMSIARGISASLRETNLLRSIIFPVAVAVVAYAVAVTGAFLLRDSNGIDGVNGLVELLSGESSSFLGGLGLVIPLGFAFAAGMASAVNPCGFAMLPAYLGLYLGSNNQGQQTARPIRQLGRALLVGGVVTAGFAVLFGVAGILLSLGTRSIILTILPFVGLAIGVLLTGIGAWLVGGGKLYTGLAAQAASRMGNPSQVNVKGYFLFGLSYGTASLSCTLPIFLSVIGTALAVSGLVAAAGQFFLYALGMGLVIIGLTIGMALFKGTMVALLRKAVPYVQPIGAWLMIIAGAYIIFYWLTIGGLL